MSLLDELQRSLGTAYTIERELGGGGMSRVFVAEERDLGRRVVVKVLPPDVAAAVSVERFRREIQLAARLQHPHIVPVLSAGAREDLLYYTMPFIAGESLRALLTRERELPMDQVLRLVRDVLDALAYAHANGVVHRDIKPDNVLISGNHAVVTDFGVSKAVSNATDPGSLTSAGIAVGTPAYMAPEQASADTAVDHRADLYAVGAMMYEMLTGRPPFVGTSAQQVLAAHVTRAPERVRAHRENVPDAVERLVMRCLEKRPSDRWQTAGELLVELETASTDRRDAARAPSAIASRDAPQLGAGGPIRRYRSFAIGAGIVVAALGVGAYVVTRDHATAVSAPARMIAVIPLLPLTSDTSDLIPEFITEQLRTAINEAHVPGLKQTNSGSADHLRGTTIDLTAARKSLGADYVVQLRFRHTGSQVTVHMELVDTRNGATDLNGDYRHADKEAETHLLAAEMAKDIIEHFGVARAAAGPARHQPTRGAEEAYMRGRAIANRASTRGELDRAVAYFEAAVRADPAYAQPLARMAMVYQSTSGADSVPPSFAYPAAEQAARRAVAIDPSNAEAHATLGWALAIRTWNWTEARREMETAIRLDPSSSVAHGNFGFLLGTEGDLRGALREADEAIRLDPYQFINHLQAIFWHLVLGQPDSALAAGRRKDEYLPGVEMPDLSISDALRESGNVDSALVIDRAMSKMVGRPTSQLVMSLERKGLHAQAVAAYDTLVQTSRRQFIAPEFLARAALAIGNRSAALQWLREAKAMHSDIMVFMRWLPDMQPLLRDPEYRQQLEEMHLSARPKTR